MELIRIFDNYNKILTKYQLNLFLLTLTFTF